MPRLCPKCNGRMEPVNMTDARNSHGLWVSAEFDVCAKCNFPIFRFVESGWGRIIVDSNGRAHEMEQAPGMSRREMAREGVGDVT